MPQIIGSISQIVLPVSGATVLGYDSGSGVTEQWYLILDDPTSIAGRWIGGPRLVMFKDPIEQEDLYSYTRQMIPVIIRIDYLR